MKKLLVVLSLAMAAFSFQASAATFNLGLVNVSKGFSNTISGAFTDTYNFSAPSNNGIGVSGTNVAVTFSGFAYGLIQNFAATLDGHLLNPSNSTTYNGPVTLFTQLLSGSLPGSAAGSHVLTFTGTGNGSYGGSIAVAQTPIPAAVWLFGSALMGLTGISRRKSANA